MSQTIVRKTPDILNMRNRWGTLFNYQEAFEIGCDLLERYLIAMVKIDKTDKLLKERKFYDSLKKTN